ncbi:MAG: hypothetical protein MJ215_05870 [Spirochaetia bacterium]|nr:hypothetical protein [Spirochaetia bacterium]
MSCIGNRNIGIENRTVEHAKRSKGIDRTEEAALHKFKFFSFIEPVLKNGRLFMKSRRYNYKTSSNERTTYGIVNKVSFFDKHKNKQITCGVEIVVAWNSEKKQYVLSTIEQKIKKSLNKDFSTTSFGACQVGACNAIAYALSTANYIILHPIEMSTITANTKDFEKSYKYIRRWLKDGKWVYEYPKEYTQNRTKVKTEIAKQTKLITGIKPLFNATLEQIDNAILQLNLMSLNDDLHCPALGNNNIVVNGKLQEHLSFSKDKLRLATETQHKAKYLPFVPALLQNGRLCEKSRNSHGLVYGIIGQVEYKDLQDKSKKEAVELAVSYDEDKRKFVLSFSDFLIGIKKSLLFSKDFDHFVADPIADTETVSITAYNLQGFNEVVNKNITVNNIKDIEKSLTWSGHKLQGRTDFAGMKISIENKKGSYRSGIDKDGHEWKTLMHYDYGYIRGTVGTDKDHVDCYLGPDKTSMRVYVIHQNDPVTGKYDEDKCMLGFSTAEDAKKAYMRQYDRPGFFGSMEMMDIETFKKRIFSQKGVRIHKLPFLAGHKTKKAARKRRL